MECRLVSCHFNNRKLFGGKQEPCHNIQENSSTPEENQGCPDYSDNVGVNVKVFPYSRANAAKHSVFTRAIKNLVLFHYNKGTWKKLISILLKRRHSNGTINEGHVVNRSKNLLSSQEPKQHCKRAIAKLAQLMPGNQKRQSSAVLETMALLKFRFFYFSRELGCI